MSIDITKDPKELFTDLLLAKNPGLGTLTKDDFNIRRITNIDAISYERTFVRDTAPRTIEEYPDLAGVEITSTGAIDQRWWIARKWMYFDGNDVTYYGKADDHIWVYLDGQLIGQHNSGATGTNTIPVLEGYHEVLLAIYEGLGYTYFKFHMTDGTNTYVSDTDWDGFTTDYTYDALDITPYSQRVSSTTVEVDLKGHGSESFGDYVTFNYGRIPINSLLTFHDSSPDDIAITVNYPIDKITMLSESIDTFEDVYNNFYRFSHLSGSGYPANAGHLDGWTYDSALDVIESTENAGTFVGLMSDELVDDYVFSTVVTSENGDNDGIAVLLGAFEQGDIDELEHTLGVYMILGNDNSKTIGIWKDIRQSTAEVLVRWDSTPLEPDNESDPQWRNYYAHVYARRTGSEIQVYYALLPLVIPDGEDRDTVIKQLVTDTAVLTEADFVTLNYYSYLIDLTTEVTDFNRSTRYGYGQFSQAYARFWNIRRPNDTPTVTEELKTYFLDTYGWNVGDEGISAENLGANSFKITFDNVVYTGDITMNAESE